MTTGWTTAAELHSLSTAEAGRLQSGSTRPAARVRGMVVMTWEMWWMVGIMVVLAPLLLARMVPEKLRMLITNSSPSSSSSSSSSSGSASVSAPAGSATGGAEGGVEGGVEGGAIQERKQQEQEVADRILFALAQGDLDMFRTELRRVEVLTSATGTSTDNAQQMAQSRRALGRAGTGIQLAVIALDVWTNARKWVDACVSALMLVPEDAKPLGRRPGGERKQRQQQQQQQQQQQKQQQQKRRRQRQSDTKQRVGPPLAGLRELLTHVPESALVSRQGSIVDVSAVARAVAEWNADFLETLIRAPDVVDVFHAQSGAVLAARDRFLATPTGEADWTALHMSCLAEYGSPKLIRLCLAHGADLHATTGYCRFTPLHLAAASLDPHLVRTLLEAAEEEARDCMCQATDRYNRTPLALARAVHDAVGGWPPAQDVVDCLVAYAAPSSPQPSNVRSSHPASAMVALTLLHTEVTLPALVQRALSLRVPFAVRGVPCAHASEQWDFRVIRERFGSHEVQLSGIPYSENYGGIAARTSTLDEYLGTLFGSADAKGDLLYCFSSATTTEIPELLDGLQLPEYMDPFVDNGTTFTWYCGPAGSGSPWHEHMSAWNILVRGRKRWFFYPPCQAVTSRLHVKRALDGCNEENNIAQEPHSGAEKAANAEELARVRETLKNSIQFVQEPGDVVFVPPHWSHAVLNLEDSVGMASEFQSASYIPVFAAPLLLSDAR